MARAGLVIVVLIGMICAGVVGVGGVGGVHTEGDANSISHVTTHANFQSLKSCRGLNGILLFLRSALDDLHALQKAPHTEGRLMGKGGRSKVRVRAMQWARKLQRRLLRLCPQQVGPRVCEENVSRNKKQDVTFMLTLFFSSFPFRSRLSSHLHQGRYTSSGLWQEGST